MSIENQFLSMKLTSFALPNGATVLNWTAMYPEKFNGLFFLRIGKLKHRSDARCELTEADTREVGGSTVGIE